MTVFNEQEKMNILKDLVAFKSVNGNELEVAEYLAKLFDKYHIKNKIIPIEDNRANLIAEIGSGKPILGISGHMDVVDPGDLSLWNSDPFELTEKDGNLYGRGATDMKSGLAAMAITMIELHEDNKPEKGTIRLLATIGEEIGEDGSRKFYEDGSTKDIDGLIIGEPTGYGIAYAQKGSMDLKLTSKGKAAHSSMPDKGFNAINPLLNILSKANQIFFDPDADKLLGNLIFNTTIFNGGTQVNSLPDLATAEVNVRTIPEYPNAKVLDEFNKLIDAENEQGADVKLQVEMNETFVAGDKNNKLVSLAQQIGQKFADADIPADPTPGITDASNLTKGKDASFPFIVFGPGNLTPHQVNEFVPKDMYLKFIDIYNELFQAFLNN